MKRNSIITIVLLLFIGVIVIVDFNISRKRFYEDQIDPILLNINHGKYLGQLLYDYYIEFGEFPDDLEELDNMYFVTSDNNKTEFTEQGREFALIDPFSKDKEYYFFQPIFNKNTGKREAYVILSRGVDGHINNKLPDIIYLDDTIIINDYFDDKVFLNAEEVEFNYLNRFFAKKDYNLNPFKTTGGKLLEAQISDCIVLDQLLENMKEGISWKVACIKCDTANITLEQNEILYSNGENILRIRLKGKIPQPFDKDTVNFLGIMQDNVYQDGEVIMNHALVK